ncbi:MAG TPA: enoyl-CoA hydratase/isomerase family protein [Syntrophomonadaceae bacterium]|nr:enoyl-CoA hydratase/isomerase family protein [Syntrophomonadaceae bacterium]
MMELDTVLFAQQDNIALVYINRPEALNAFNKQLLMDLQAAFDWIQEHQDIAVSILSGKGPAFAGGADLALAQNFNKMAATQSARMGQKLMNKIEALHCPVIAAINGPAIGSGAELAWACDFRIASSKAYFMHPEVKFGFCLGWGGSQRLPFLVGRQRAMEIMLLGEAITAEKALEWGLVYQVAAPEELEQLTMEVAQKIARYHPAATSSVKMSAIEGYRTSGTSMAYESHLWGECFANGEPQKRIKLFLDSRKLNK